MKISRGEYNLISKLVKEKFGIHLGDKKQALVAGRLNKVLKDNGFRNFKEYYNHIISDTSNVSLNELINRLSTNHTYFFREKIHFEYFIKNILPHLNQTNKTQKEIRVWSCGCSSGEEAYTLAILMNEFSLKNREKWLFKVLATDISEKVLQLANEGIYAKENISRLPVSIKHKYFTSDKNGFYKIDDGIKEMVFIRRLNLLRNNLPFKKKFDVVFCRNVMIYFDQETRESFLKRVALTMAKNGFLFIGLSESINRKDCYFKYIQPGVYQKYA